ncbi:MAG: hypothetical protein LC803_09275 [Acidobacteria bacterium]|nr:hypothetical protein [Acidobacteriota bacterium]
MPEREVTPKPFDPRPTAYQAGYLLGRLLAGGEEERRHRVEAIERETHHTEGEVVTFERQVSVEDTYIRRR